METTNTRMNKDATTWYANLVADCNTLAERFGLDDTMNEELRDFVMRVAKEQYKVGNKSGIRWIRSEMAKQNQTPVSFVAAAA